MYLHEFLNLTYSYDNLIQYLSDKQVIRSSVQCPKCGNIITYSKTDNSYTMHCTNAHYKTVPKRKKRRIICNFKISIFNNTWFSNTHLDIVKVSRFIAYFLTIQPPRHSFLCNELELPEHTVVDWTNFCRELLAQYFVKEQQQLGGPGIIVEIDKAKISKRKYNKGRILQTKWVFGGIERNSGKVFIVPVIDRSSKALLPLIRKYIAPGTTIYSDCSSAYYELKNENYVH
ncbi:uncharacterized protein LOC105283073 [Ooceraea biroi]|nr:uncharacterized protein LOC105283073 [Ooceraea biroi]